MSLTVRSIIFAATVAMLSVVPAYRAAAQTAASGEMGRSASAGSGWVRAQSVTSPTLRRTIDLDLDEVSVQEAITEIAKLGGLPIGYDGSVIASNARVSLRGTGLTVNEAPASALRGTELEAYVSMASGQVVLRAAPGPDPKPAAPALTGTIVGRVTDGATGAPVAGADVRVLGTQLGATANDSGRYVLPDVPAGEQSVTVQRIGYETQKETVTVPEGGTVTLNIALGAMATRLDELVVTVTGEQRVREVGNVVARIQADSLASLAPVMSFGDLLQGRAPGVLSLTEGSYSGQAGRIRIRRP